MRVYKCLNKNVFNNGDYSIVPIRDEDKYAIMQWRNEQIYHLRQSQLLTEEIQQKYFNNVIARLFTESKPTQLLFSYLHKNICVGYGGLVHINWVDKHAEISFLLDTSLEKKGFAFHWHCFLHMIEEVAFAEIKMHKIFTYAFDLRAHLYNILEGKGFKKEAVLTEHCLFEGKYINVVIHSKINTL